MRAVDSHRKRLFACFGVAGLLTLIAAGPARAALYDWSTTTAGNNIDHNGGWQDRNDNEFANDVVKDSSQPTGFSGNYAELGDGAIYERVNDSNFSYSIPQDAPGLRMSFLLHTDSNTKHHMMGLRKDSANADWRFGQSGDHWGFRDQNHNFFPLGNGTGDGELTIGLQTFKVTVELDLINNTLDFLVDELGTPDGPETIATGQALGDFGPVENFDALYLRGDDNGAQTDNFSVEVIPEPASLALLAPAGLLLMRRRR